jgi:hypothetical protein
MKLTVILNIPEADPDLPPQFAALSYLELVKGSMQQPTPSSALPLSGNISLPDGTPVGTWSIE